MTDINTYGSPSGGAEARTREGAREGTGEAIAAVKAEAVHFAASAGDKAQDKLAAGQKAVGDGVGQFADALRQAGENLDQGEQSLVSGLVRQAADGLESVARGVADKKPEEMLAAVRDFGRQNPGALIAASVLAGVALGRLARASGERVAPPETATVGGVEAADPAMDVSEGLAISDDTQASPWADAGQDREG